MLTHPKSLRTETRQWPRDQMTASQGTAPLASALVATSKRTLRLTPVWFCMNFGYHRWVHAHSLSCLHYLLADALKDLPGPPTMPSSQPATTVDMGLGLQTPGVF